MFSDSLSVEIRRAAASTQPLDASFKLRMTRRCRHNFLSLIFVFAAVFTSCSRRQSIVSQPAPAQNLIVIGNQLNVPVKIVGLNIMENGDRKGDLTIQIENVSGQRVDNVIFWLLPMPCRQYNMGNLTIAYNNALRPGERASISVGRVRVDGYVNPKGSSSIPCSSDPEEKPHLALTHVTFADGSVWKIGPSSS